MCLKKVLVSGLKRRANKNLSWCKVIEVKMQKPSGISFKNFLRSKYSPEVKTLTTGYQRCVEKLARFRNHVVFTARCKHAGVAPTSLKVRCPITTRRGRNIAERAERQFLNERLRVTNYRVKNLEEEKKWREIGVRRALDTEDLERFMRISNENAELVFTKTRDRQKRKFDKLMDTHNRPKAYTQAGTRDIIDKTKWVYNLSAHELTKEETSVLQKGLNFAPMQKSVPRTEIIAGVETALRSCAKINAEEAERTRASIAAIIRNAAPPKPNVTPGERLAMRALSQNKDIIIVPCGQGQCNSRFVHRRL